VPIFDFSSRCSKNNLAFQTFKRRFRKLCVEFWIRISIFKNPWQFSKNPSQFSKQWCHIRVSISIFEIATTIYFQKTISIFYSQSSIIYKFILSKTISIFKNVILFSSFNLYFQNFSDDLNKLCVDFWILISILKNRFPESHHFSLSSN